MARRSKPWWKNRQWCVVATTPQGPKEIYCTATKKQAQSDAKKWRAEMRQPTRVVPGEGHKTRRDAGMGATPAWWPFGHKKAKPAARHPMTRTVYYARTASGTYKPVDRPPSHAMAGARRKKRRR